MAGSPPPVWGTPRGLRQNGLELRITPTCVGNTDSLAYEEQVDKGSPPPVWGTPSPPSSRFGAVRITPTCVGNTRQYSFFANIRQDHPHLCGEHSYAQASAAYNKGSPPPVWGTQKMTKNIKIDFRITPTCVGNTVREPVPNKVAKDHPHLCGEH